MRIKNFKKNKRNKGAAMLILVIFFLFISLAVISGLVSPILKEYGIANDLIKSRQSLFLSESGIEDAYFRLKNGETIGSLITTSLGDNKVEISVADSGYNEKTITGTGNVFLRERTNEITLTTGTGAAFGYGVQAGTGGITMGSGSSVQGSVYSNGTIVGSGSITGTAVSANAPALTADQTNGLGIPFADVAFGNADATQDFAQSFEVSVTERVSNIELYLKKVGAPSNLTVRIVSDSNDSPSSTTLASGPLSASLVSTNYGWINVPLSSNPELTAGTTYWIVVDGGTSFSRYYFIGANSDGYDNGIGKSGRFGSFWNDTSPSGLDAYFRLYLGGFMGLIDGITIGIDDTGNAYAHTVNDSNVAGTIYCQTGSDNNKTCDTSLADPTQVAMPISEQNILDWKAEAEEGGTHLGNYIFDDVTSSLGPQKITGDLIVTNGSYLTLNGTVWVMGDIEINNNAEVSLSASYGTSDGMLIADGDIDIKNNAIFFGSGSEGSYIMALSTSTSTSAITLANNGGAVILYAANGTVNLANNSEAKALNGKYINMYNNSTIIYESGLANSNFVNGPSGGWKINSWRETR